MTMIGAICSADRAFLWADTEIYLDDQPCGHRAKIAVNEKARTVACAAGDTLLLDVLFEAVERVVDHDELITALPGFAARNWWRPRRIKYTTGPRVLAVGWSRQLGRLAGHEFLADDFRPRVFRAAATPYVPEIEGIYPGEPADLLGLAQAQMREVQKVMPLAGGGKVTLAEISRDGAIALRTLYDFDVAAHVRRQIQVLSYEAGA